MVKRIVILRLMIRCVVNFQALYQGIMLVWFIEGRRFATHLFTFLSNSNNYTLPFLIIWTYFVQNKVTNHLFMYILNLMPMLTMITFLYQTTFAKILLQKGSQHGGLVVNRFFAGWVSISNISRVRNSEVLEFGQSTICEKCWNT